ncbi:hypothetical protein BJ508DRAFT_325895 [Ascobolus immersus RN42]|uniref:Uncharacterized protein n=1 Tax=Ascobolus immersus RN42 TaxID=1160509 RepID=A0A3N4I7R5_ASCIM|nr:hypothetical protein BJ508DRAFT_325895 [Ascobolus immersus RN42]
MAEGTKEPQQTGHRRRRRGRKINRNQTKQPQTTTDKRIHSPGGPDMKLAVRDTDWDSNNENGIKTCSLPGTTPLQDIHRYIFTCLFGHTEEHWMRSAMVLCRGITPGKVEEVSTDSPRDPDRPEKNPDRQIILEDLLNEANNNVLVLVAVFPVGAGYPPCSFSLLKLKYKAPSSPETLPEDQRDTLARDLKEPLYNHMMNLALGWWAFPRQIYCCKQRLSVKDFRSLCLKSIHYWEEDEGFEYRATHSEWHGTDLRFKKHIDNARLFEIDLTGDTEFLGKDIEKTAASMLSVRIIHHLHARKSSIKVIYDKMGGSEKVPSPMEVLSTIAGGAGGRKKGKTNIELGPILIVVNGIEALGKPGMEFYARSVFNELIGLGTLSSRDSIFVCWTCTDDWLFLNGSDGDLLRGTARLGEPKTSRGFMRYRDPPEDAKRDACMVKFGYKDSGCRKVLLPPAEPKVWDPDSHHGRTLARQKKWDEEGQDHVILEDGMKVTWTELS